MSKPQNINIENELVYLADDLYKYDTSFFTGCSRMRLIIEKKKLKLLRSGFPEIHNWSYYERLLTDNVVKGSRKSLDSQYEVYKTRKRAARNAIK